MFLEAMVFFGVLAPGNTSRMRLDLSMRNRRLDVPKGDGQSATSSAEEGRRKCRSLVGKLPAPNAISGPRFRGLSTRRPRRSEPWKIAYYPPAPHQLNDLTYLCLIPKRAKTRALEGAIIRL
jgi:hypothetical protein